MVAIVVVVGSVLALLVYSAFQLYTSKWENEGGRIDWVQMFLLLATLLDLPCIFLPYELIFWGPSYRWLTQTVVFVSAVIPFVVGAWVLNRKGPARRALPVACPVPPP